MRYTTSLLLLLLVASHTLAQSPRIAYHQEGNVLRHELNPAFQPEVDYFTLPLLGNSTVSVQSNMQLSDFLYTRADGTQTTFMARGTIDKSKLLDKVGSAYKLWAGIDATLISLGRHLDKGRYQTFSAAVHVSKMHRAGRGVFDLLKDVENRSYDVSDLRLNVSAYAELTAGESWLVNERWSLGAKAKLLIGLAYFDLQFDPMHVTLSRDRWLAQGTAKAQAAGLTYHTTQKDYFEAGRGHYTAVTGLGLSGLKPNGLGLAVDLGTVYRPKEHLTLSLSVRDLGFITWWKATEAENTEKEFQFEGFRDACFDIPDADYSSSHPTREPLRQKMDRLRDDFLSLAHLEEGGHGALTQLLGATLHGGLSYHEGAWTAGALLTTQIQGNLTWAEARAQLTYSHHNLLDFTLSPAYSTTGFAMGAMVSYRPNHGCQFYLGSDALATTFNRQLLPTSLSGSLHLGIVFVR